MMVEEYNYIIVTGYDNITKKFQCTGNDNITKVEIRIIIRRFNAFPFNIMNLQQGGKIIMTGPNILLTRIDNRLVHGQVGVTWTTTLGANLLIVADDDVAKDKLQQQLMSMTAESSGVGIRFLQLNIRLILSVRPHPIRKYLLFAVHRKKLRDY